MATEKRNLHGCRVLVVEDQLAIALAIEAVLKQLGCEVVGPHARLASALEAARRERLDCAILDINLQGDSVAPIANELAGRGVPAIVATGYPAGSIPPSLRALPRIEKPYLPGDLERLIRRAVARRPLGAR